MLDSAGFLNELRYLKCCSCCGSISCLVQALFSFVFVYSNKNMIMSTTHLEK